MRGTMELLRPLMTMLALVCVLDVSGGEAARKEAVVTAVRQVTLASPLNTLIPVETLVTAPDRLEAELVVGDDAPADLGVSAWVADAHGRWFRSPRALPLKPGRQRVSFDLGEGAGLLGEPHRAQWTRWSREQIAKAGLFVWSATVSNTVITVPVIALVREPAARPATSAPASVPVAAGLRDLELDGFDPHTRICRTVTGQRWTLALRPDPFPAQPYDGARFALAAVFSAPDGQQWRVGGFYRQPLAIRDRGDNEEGVPLSPARFEVRFRPSRPGTYQVKLEASWDGGAPQVTDLPQLEVTGEPWDDYVRVDAGDPRFFSIGSRIDQRRFYWPVGLNLHSVWDLRTRDCCRTKLTPNRIWNGYEAYLRRLAANGGNSAEIWMASWSLILEWRRDWNGFHGTGRYSEENSERLDRVLDLARELGIRVNLVIYNHGQASVGADHEWENSPWNTANGGPLAAAQHYFTDPLALAGQEQLRRYIIARYADHPAVMGWKLWSEQNLTAGGGHLRQWHVKAAERWQLLDPYGHGVTTHWAGDYRSPDRVIVAQPGMSYICIDAYHGRGSMLAQLIYDGTQAIDGLGRYGKPILVTEYGGSPGACPEPQLIAEHHTGAWAGMVSGNAGAPMLWWFEWVDQREQWAAYRAVTSYLDGEDLRGADARPAAIAVIGGLGPFWSRAWVRPGRMLGYVLDHDWGVLGEVDREHKGVKVRIGEQVAAGRMAVEWWDAEKGGRIGREEIVHPGGTLDLAAPAFKRHLAYKLVRHKGDGVATPPTAAVPPAGERPR